MSDLDLDAIRHSVGVTHSEVSALCSHVDDLLAELERLKAERDEAHRTIHSLNAWRTEPTTGQ